MSAILQLPAISSEDEAWKARWAAVVRLLFTADEIPRLQPPDRDTDRRKTEDRTGKK